jgi:cytoskeletal protein RodZ
MPTSTSLPPKDAPSVLDVSGDFRNLRTHGAASLEELKGFLGKLRRKSPQEVIGIVSSSLLIQSIVIATAITFVFMVVFTVGPFLFLGHPQVKAVKTPAAAAAPASTAGVATKTTTTKAEKSAGPSEEDTAKAVKAMGMDETKTADPKANPLEKDFDKLLDGAK